MPKGQSSRVATLPRELLDAFHFPACSLGCFISPTNISQSLQLANHTQLPHCYIQYDLSTLSVFFFVKSNFFKVPQGHIKAPKWHLKGLLATSKWHALTVYSGCHHGKM